MFSASIVDAAVRSCGRKVSGACRGLSWWRQPLNPVVDTGSKGCHQAEEGVLSGPIGPCWPVGLLTQLTGYRQAKQAAARARTVLEAKTWVWEEFGVRPWRRTIGQPRRDSGKPSGASPQKGEAVVLCQHCLQCRWGAVDLDWGHCRTDAEVTEVVQQAPRSGKAPGVDEIRPEYLKSLDVVGLSWLTRLCNIAWRLGTGTVPLEWQTGVVVPLFKKLKRGPESVFQLQGDHTSQPPPGKVYARVLERRIQADSRPSDSGGTMRFSSWSWNTGPTSSIPLHRVLEGLWEFAQPVHVHVLCGSGRRHSTVSLVVFCGECSMRVWGPGAFAKGCSVSLYDREQELGSHCRWQTGFLWRSQGPEGVRFGNHRISSLLFADDVQDLQHVLEWFAAECEAAGMRISTSKSEAMVLDRKRVACPLRVGGEVLASSGGVQVSRGLVHDASAVMCGRCTGPHEGEGPVKKELSRKAKLSQFTGQSMFPPSPMVMNFG
ncbi:hypothetical protein L3Q82_019265 [Scortum barcoo]|uniref:Uncharacterized protein n=1 Tax=Scortum barcoo TaxID=214431 RepID=A0ACB8VCJ5_9TELE|nr:hypothetical protein L3Q82_019265 [Scortum barcoo]